MTAEKDGPGLEWVRDKCGTIPDITGKVLCPFHEDRNPSMQINAWNVYCYACGQKWSLTEYAAQVAGGTDASWKEEYKKYLRKWKGGSAPASKKTGPRIRESRSEDEAKPRTQWKTPTYVYDPTGAPPDQRRKEDLVFVKEDMGWDYHSANGDILYRASRFILPKDKKGRIKKVVKPYMRTNDRWVAGILADNRPLFNLPELVSAANIFIVEGEKCAACLNGVLSSYNAQHPTDYAKRLVATTYAGGAHGWKKTDLEPLRGKNVFLWPDRDTDKKGELVFLAFAQHLANYIAAKVQILKPLDSWEPPYDCYDYFNTPSKPRTYKSLFGLVKDRCTEISPYYEVESQDKPLDESYANNRYYQILGVRENNIVYLHKMTGTVHEERSTKFSSAAQLTTMAAKEWWQEMSNYDGDGKGGFFNKSRCEDFHNLLCREAQLAGGFDYERVAGRGWHWVKVEKRRMAVCHTGRNLILHNQKLSLTALSGDKIWISKQPIDWGDPNKQADNDFMSKIVEGIETFPFATATDARLMMGWALLAPLCGLLDFRPGMWLQGESGVGKTTFLSFLRKLLGGTLATHMGGTTEPAIRRSLMHDAIAIALDEQEIETDRERLMQSEIMKLMRVAATEGSGTIIKADQNSAHGVVGGKMKSMMLFSSIAMGELTASNQSRIAQVEMVRPSRAKPSDYYVNANTVTRWLDSLIEPSQTYLHWVMKHVDLLMEAVKVGKSAALSAQIQHRDADVLAPLLAAYLVGLNRKVPLTTDLEKVFADLKNDGRELSTMIQRDHDTLIYHILNYTVDISPFTKQGGKTFGHSWIPPEEEEAQRQPVRLNKVLLGALITRALELPVEMLGAINPQEANDMLRHYGICLLNKLEGSVGKDCPGIGRVWFARRHPTLIAALKGTPFARVDYSKMLMRAPTAKSVSPKRYGGLVSRGVEISTSDLFAD